MAGTAHLFFTSNRGAVTAVSAAVTRIDQGLLTLRCLRNGAVEAGRHCVVAISTEDGQRRARATVLDVSDVSVRVRLDEALDKADRATWSTADVVLRFMARRLETRAPARRKTGALSLVPERDAWHVEEVVLSPSGMRAALPGEWRVGELLELHLHVPGRAGGDHFVTTAEILQIHDDEAPVEYGLRFLDLDGPQRAKLGEIVDRARLSDLFDDA